VWGRRFASSGAPLDDAFQVNGSTVNVVRYPDVAFHPASGSFLVVWQVDPDSGDTGKNIAARLFDSAGAPVGNAFRVNSHVTGDQVYPKVAALPSGFVVGWSSEEQTPGSGRDVYAQRLDLAGSPAGSEFHVNAYTSGTQTLGGLASSPTGDFMLTWWSDSQDGDGSSIQARRYGSSGASIGGGFRVNEVTTGSQYRPDVDYDVDGGFVVVWMDAIDFDADVHARRFDSAGNGGASFRVNTGTTGGQSLPRIATSRLFRGRYLVVWHGPDGDNTGVFGQSFCRKGDANLDGNVDVLDVFFVINFLFAGGVPSSGCPDVNGLAGTDVLDVFYLINHLFAGGPAPV
jgi:hypothetical protein